MSGVRVTIDDAAVQKALQKLLDTSENLRPFFDEVGSFMDSELQEQFQRGTDAYGFPWVQSERAADGGKTLVDRGHLRDSFHSLVAFDGQALVFGSNMVYAAIHQFGGDTGRKGATHLPARPMLPHDGWPTNWEEEIMTLLTEHLDV